MEKNQNNPSGNTPTGQKNDSNATNQGTHTNPTHQNATLGVKEDDKLDNQKTGIQGTQNQSSRVSNLSEGTHDRDQTGAKTPDKTDAKTGQQDYDRNNNPKSEK
jgi:hypothetical protein